MDILQFVSIVIEIGVAVLGVMIAREKKRLYGWFIALAFSIYALYAISNLFSFEISHYLLTVFFLIASISIFFAVWKIYKRR